MTPSAHIYCTPSLAATRPCSYGTPASHGRESKQEAGGTGDENTGGDTQAHRRNRESKPFRNQNTHAGEGQKKKSSTAHCREGPRLKSCSYPWSRKNNPGTIAPAQLEPGAAGMGTCGFPHRGRRGLGLSDTLVVSQRMSATVQARGVQRDGAVTGGQAP